MKPTNQTSWRERWKQLPALFSEVDRNRWIRSHIGIFEQLEYQKVGKFYDVSKVVEELVSQELQSLLTEVIEGVHQTPLMDGKFVGEKADEFQLASETAVLAFKNRVLSLLKQKQEEL